MYCMEETGEVGAKCGVCQHQDTSCDNLYVHADVIPVFDETCRVLNFYLSGLSLPFAV